MWTSADVVVDVSANSLESRELIICKGEAPLLLTVRVVSSPHAALCCRSNAPSGDGLVACTAAACKARHRHRAHTDTDTDTYTQTNTTDHTCTPPMLTVRVSSPNAAICCRSNAPSGDNLVACTAALCNAAAGQTLKPNTFCDPLLNDGDDGACTAKQCCLQTCGGVYQLPCVCFGTQFISWRIPIQRRQRMRGASDSTYC